MSIQVQQIIGAVFCLSFGISGVIYFIHQIFKYGFVEAWEGLDDGPYTLVALCPILVLVGIGFLVVLLK